VGNLAKETAVTITLSQPATPVALKEAVRQTVFSDPYYYSEKLYFDETNGGRTINIGQQAAYTEKNFSVGPEFDQMDFDRDTSYLCVTVWCNPQLAVELHDDYDGDDWPGYVAECVAKFAARLQAVLNG
jgi:hypothetical protein